MDDGDCEINPVIFTRLLGRNRAGRTVLPEQAARLAGVIPSDAVNN